jgi:hypothetical protein
MLVLVGIGMREEEGERGDGISLGGEGLLWEGYVYT